MKMLKRTLALMLVLCMMFSAVPFNAFATESTDEPSIPAETPVDAPEGENTPSEDETVVDETVADETVADETVADKTVADETVVKEAPAMMRLTKAASTSVDYRILHLDCGRKYFTADWIKALINEMAAAGYNQLQLAFGNDGLRFLLDDMSFTANGTPYAHNTVVSKVEAGNKAQNDSGDGSWLTQAEMDAIIAHANSKGIEIVPLLNLPGHANAILDIADNAYNASGSDNTLDVANNDEAQAFGMAILKKYVDYFAGKGCNFFSFGADEYANDASGAFSFSRLSTAEYNKFVSFIQNMVAYIEGKGMTPRAFNDGLYYNNMNVTMDTDIQCCYWSSGWSGYTLASASTISSKGHPMINTLGDFYYVLGKNECWTTGDTTTHDPNLYTAASSFDVTQFSKYTGYSWTTETISNPAGAMFCIWCDYPNFETEAQVASNVRLVLRAMAAEMNGNDASSISTSVVAGGFNSDGSINGAPQPELVTKTDANVSVTAYDLTGLTVTTAAAPTIEGATAALAWNVTPVTADGNYTGSAEVTLPVPADWTNVRGGVLASDNGEEVMGIQGTLENGYFTFTVPHFSNVIAYNLEANITNTVNVRIPVGGTSQTYTQNDGNHEASAKIADDTVAQMNISGNSETGNASYDAVNTIESGAQYLITINNHSITSQPSNGYNGSWTSAAGLLMTQETSESNLWTITQVTGGYTVRSANGKYLNIAADNNSVTLSDTPVTLSVIDNGNTFTFHNNYYCLNNFGGASTFASSYQIEYKANEQWTLKKYTPATVESTTVSFTGLKIGTTYAVVGTTQYNIEVLDPTNMFTKEEDVELLVNETKTFTDNTGNYEASYTGAGLNQDIAKVEVKGTTVAGSTTVTPITSLPSDKTNTFYIQVSDGVYLTSSAGTTQNLSEAGLWYADGVYYGYCTIRSASNDYYLGDNYGAEYLHVNQFELYMTMNNGKLQGWYSEEVAGTPVTVTATAPVDATDITITGVSGGETSVVVGETRYNITVIGTTDITIKYQTANGAVIKTETAQVPDTATTYTVSNFTHTNGKFYVVDNTTLNITPATVTEYTVTVTETEEDLSTVDPITIEYWITNGVVKDPSTSLSYLEISAEQEGIYSANGVALTDLLPEILQREGRNTQYWRATLLDVTKINTSTSGTEEQTLLTGDDETLNTNIFSHIRYWNGAWQVLVGTNWVSVNRTEVTVKTYDNQNETGTATRETNQLVAYYMEVIDIQNSNGTNELHVNAADWGFKSGDNWGYGTGEFDPCTVSVQIVYEDNTSNPASTSTSDLLSKTLVYGYWESGRGLGTMIFNGEGENGYMIYKVTAETGDAAFTNNYNGFTINELTWDNNEEIVWSGYSHTATIGNTARQPSYEEPYDNLAWNTSNYNHNNAILIRVYVKAAATQDSLNVHYMDRSANNLEFYNYSIPVKVVEGEEAPVFNAGFAMGSTTNSLVNNTVTNYYGSTQTVSADLQTMPQIKAYYRYCNYTLVEVERSEDGKNVYLYYTFTPVVSFVADFGLPIKITPADLNAEGYNNVTITDVQVIGSKDTVAGHTANSEYGTLSVDGTTVTYTPTQILPNVDFFSVYVETTADNPNTTVNDSAGINYRVYVFPATTVFYEESFFDVASGWSTTAMPTKHQATEVLGDSTYYGYDSAYAADASGSNGTSSTAIAVGATTSFTFVGTGFDLYANCTTSSGYVAVQVRNEAGNVVKMYTVDTVVDAGKTSATTGQNTDEFHLPIVSEQGLAHGTYTVTVRKIANDSKTVKIDGVRIFNTLADSTVYAEDLEDNPAFYQLRDSVLNAIEIGDTTSEDYGTLTEMADQVFNQLTANGETPVAVITDTNNIYGDYTAQDLLDNGPKNELFLYAGQTLTFKVTTNRVMQIGLKAPVAGTSYTLKVDNNVVGSAETDLNTAVDMFYKLAENTNTAKTYTVSVENTGSNILSVTDLKICDDPNFAFAPLTVEDIAAVMGVVDEPEVPETPVEPEVPEVPEEPTKPTEPQKPSKPEKPGKPENNKPEKPENNKPEKPENNKPGKPEDNKPTKPTEPEVEETKPSKPENNKPAKPGKEEKAKTLKVTFVNLLGKKVGTATITTTDDVVSAYEIVKAAPAGRTAIWLIPVALRANGNTSVVVPVI